MIDITIGQERFNQAVIPATLLPRAVVNFTQNVVTIEAQSESHLIKFRSTIPESIFTKYKIKEDTTFGIHTEDILKLIQMSDDRSDINIRFDKANRRIIFISRTLKYRTPELDPRYVSNKYVRGKDDLALELSINKEIDKFCEAIKLANKIATYCTLEFHSDKSTVVLEANGDLDDLQIEIMANFMFQRLDNEIGFDERLQNRYSLDKLVDILEIVPVDKAVKIGVTQNSELILSFSFANVGEIYFKLNDLIR